MSASMIAAVKQAATERFPMIKDGIHGPLHWERVRENAVYLVRHSGGDPVVAELFAWLHDCCRENDGADPQHGARAAEFAESLRGEVLVIDDRQFALLHYACANHTHGRNSDDSTIGACWDADRLDLGRVGLFPSRRFLSTGRALDREVIDWCYARSLGQDARLNG